MNWGRDFQSVIWKNVRPFLLQVFRLEDSCCLFTLQGHSGAITTVYIDQVRAWWWAAQGQAMALVSDSWDLLGSRVRSPTPQDTLVDRDFCQ